MSAENSTENKELKPRKKSKKKRKANSPLIDTEQRNQDNGANSGSPNVSNEKAAFNFSNCIQPQNLPSVMNFSQQQGPFSQGVPVFGAGAYPPPSQSPNQMASFTMPPSQATGPPNWATELISDVKQMKSSLTKLDQIEKTVNLIHMKVTDLETKVSSIETRVDNVEKSCQFMSSENEDRKRDLAKAKTDIANLKGKCDNMEKNTRSFIENSAKLESKVADLESRSMRDNLLFYGAPEGGESENCENIVKTICADKLKLPEAHALVFDRVHRVGNPSHNKVRPIVAKFHYFKQREAVRQASYAHANELKDAKMGIGVQWPQQVREARKALYPIMQQEKTKGNTVKLVKDKLFVNGIEYVPGQQQQQQQQQR